MKEIAAQVFCNYMLQPFVKKIPTEMIFVKMTY